MDVPAPDTRNSPITAAYVITHNTHTSFSTNERCSTPRYSTAARAKVDPAKRYPGTLSRTSGRATKPAMARSVAKANQIAPNTATGMPPNVPNRLEYTCVQLTVALTSQKLTYPTSASIR